MSFFNKLIKLEKLVRAWTNCKTNGWYLDGGDFINADSPASQGMMNFICQPQSTTSFR